MSRPFTISRRNATMLIAGAFAGSAAPAAAASVRTAAAPAAAQVHAAALNGDHHHIAELLANVRRANGAVARERAFARCKDALRNHDRTEAAIAALDDTARIGASALYRHTDPSIVLARVIVRELDARPTTDASWLARFADLEAAFAAHVADQQHLG